MNLYRKLVATKVDSSNNDVESGVELLLKKLQQVNFQMQAWVSSGGSEMVSHTLTRHQEILQDLTQMNGKLFEFKGKREPVNLHKPSAQFIKEQPMTSLRTKMISTGGNCHEEFYRLRSGLRAKQEHASLLQDFREFDRSRLDLEESGISAELALLKEHASISRSTGQMDPVISQSQSTLGALVLQGSTFGGINSKLSNVSSRLPVMTKSLDIEMLTFSRTFPYLVSSTFTPCTELRRSAEGSSHGDPGGSFPTAK
ncbi:hypothetical protein Nepgr_005443 [Nepenthes gracilis]|uniref:Golgi SNAP receptor complex member 1 n=1 Tax=Nepenthes gracilis TaxID=150966 RepID=A0AAD3S373_NEPGR|nr:hypothetical protein Nepgr_005443 [Nepenthes gracilis]